jgi:hypothetical protein
MAQTIEDLGRKVKAKYPGQYDDLADADLGAKVKAKYPGAYDDFEDSHNLKRPMPNMGSGQSMRAPTDPLEKAQGLYQSYTPDVIQNFVKYLIKAGQYSGLSDPITAYAGPAGQMEHPIAAMGGKAEDLLSSAKSKINPTGLSYKQAKDIKNTYQERNLALNADIASQRTAMRETLSNERRNAQQLFNQQEQDRIQPLISEQNVLKNARGRTSAKLAEQRTTTRENLQSDLSQLNQQKKVATDAATEKINKNVSDFAEGIGTEMSKEDIAKGTQESRAAAWKQYTDKVTTLYDEVRDIFSKNVSQVQEGVDEAGQPIMKDVAGAIDLSSVQKELKPLYDRFKQDLAIARNNGSPGAKAVIEIVEGKNVVPGDVAIDNLKALNRLGYGKADAVFREASEAYARKAASAYRTALDESIGNMEGGDRIREALDEAKGHLQNRDKLLRTGDVIKGKPIAKSAATTVETTGDVTKLIKQPIKFNAYWNQIADTPVESGAMNQISKYVLGSGYKDFSKRWAEIPSGIKARVYTPEQIAKGDKLSQEGPMALQVISEDALAKNTEIVKRSMEELNAIGQRKSELEGLTRNVRDIGEKINRERLAIREGRQSQSADRVQAAIASKKSIDAQALERKTQLIQELKQAQQKIDQIKKIKTVAGIAAVGAAGKWIWKAAHVSSLLGWTP